ncbi:dihydropteroate synthase [Domibacillus epiphyticus]|uniref:Dihydropteroate synthase n=1 Tax=Domibacillus epiphyticus TaxID=1714355 RepID=A0A1V2A776_9BACI|nr:dihydropteroate synthase [Domibacillus epiphyticus]OMP66816.1 dihydropteroate synthase [Domibacillus epiphyticus]
MKAGRFELDFHKQTYVMGILNTTPDSFSDGGNYNDSESAVRHAVQMVKDGAHIIDIGGESTRPGHIPVSADDEITRVQPIIEAVARIVDVPISIDTYKAETAQKAVEAGASIINDIWGAKKDPDIAAVAANMGVPIILMHNRDNMDYSHFMRDCLNDLHESITIAKKAGVPDDQIILDPGIGFVKTMDQNIEMMQHLDHVAALGYPVLLGTSRKRVIDYVLNVPVEERMEGTGATCCFGVQKGCHIVRVHDVKPIARMMRMMDALIGKGHIYG